MMNLFDIYSEEEVISVLNSLSNPIVTDVICVIYQDLAKLDYIKMTRLYGNTSRIFITEDGRNFYNELISSQ